MRARLLVLASSIGSLGWGAVLPYQFAYAAETRGWGLIAAAAAASLFSLGALVAAPVAGRLADRFDPVTVAVVSQLIGAVAVGLLVFVGDATAFLLGMLVFGLGLAGAVPAKQVLALQWSSSGDRRKVFAYKFTGESLGMAAGAFLAGLVVDLDRVDGLDVGFLMAAGGFVLSSLIIGFAGRVRVGGAADAAAAPAGSDAFADGGEAASAGLDAETGAIAVIDTASGSRARRGALRTIFADPALRWIAVLTTTLALGFYAQFESGLPAYAITVLAVDPSVIGTAAAVNCIVIVLLQVAVVKLTAKRNAASLLMVVAGIWVFSWVLLSVAHLTPGIAAVVFVTTYGIFAVGETMYSPVLNPLTASLAPRGMVGQTLGTVAALQTAFSAAGPLVAGVLLGAGLADAFLWLHIGISLAALFAAWRIRRLLAARDAARASVARDADAARADREPPTAPIGLVGAGPA
jgi:Na+/melibiose symporter-like transporter